VTTLNLALVMSVLIGLLTAVVVDLATTVRRLSRRVDDLQRDVDRARSRQNVDRLTRDRGHR
jgi:outer membrane murein-binding lipoprotein Lpp